MSPSDKLVLPVIFAWRSSQIRLGWLPCRHDWTEDRPAQPPISATISDTINLRIYFIFIHLSARVSIIMPRSKSLIFQWRVFAEATQAPARPGKPRGASRFARCASPPLKCPANVPGYVPVKRIAADHRTTCLARSSSQIFRCWSFGKSASLSPGTHIGAPALCREAMSWSASCWRE
jgi:hypothetical protein